MHYSLFANELYSDENELVDMGSNQYPSIGRMNSAVKGTMGIKYPFHVSEYAHSMGNACGNLIDYWNALESTNFFCGGAIWDWVDQAVYTVDPATGERFLAYGGDFGDKPNSGQFVMNGIIFADRELKPQYHEVKKVYQNIAVTAVDTSEGLFKVFNKHYFNSLSDYELSWSLWKDGVKTEGGTIVLPTTDARARAKISVPYDKESLVESSEYFMKFQFKLAENQPWAEASYVQAEEQIQLKAATHRPSLAEVSKKDAGDVALAFKEGTDAIKEITGEGFAAKFNC